MALRKTYVGFSTQNAERTRKWSSYDVELVKRDLYNHFFTQIGERVMRPNFGCAIWDYLYEPLTPANRQAVLAEVERICRSDPRVELVTTNLFELESGLRIEVTLNFIGLAVVETFNVDFEAAEDARFSGSLEFTS